MTGVLVVNAGSSSLKLRVLSPADDVTASLDIDQWDGSADHDEFRQFLDSQSGVGAVGHRVVHGGSRFTRAALIDDDVRAEIADLTDLAPLHQPRALAGISGTRAALPVVPAFACFDTAFHATLPAAAARYALPDHAPHDRIIVTAGAWDGPVRMMHRSAHLGNVLASDPKWPNDTSK
jgi:acetate kinase